MFPFKLLKFNGIINYFEIDSTGKILGLVSAFCWPKESGYISYIYYLLSSVNVTEVSSAITGGVTEVTSSDCLRLATSMIIPLQILQGL